MENRERQMPEGGKPGGSRVVILAAGHGTRMGGPKAFRMHGGRTFLERVLSRCRESASPVTLVCDPSFRERMEHELDRLDAPPLTIAEADGLAPMLESARAGLAAAESANGRAGAGDRWHGGFWLWPVDAPFLSADGWTRAREAVGGAPEEVWKLRVGGKTGHPIWFPGWSVSMIRAGDWPDGLLGFLATCPARLRILPLAGEYIFDVNTPEELVQVPAGL